MQHTPREATPIPTHHEDWAGTWPDQSDRAPRALGPLVPFGPVTLGNQPVSRTPSSEWIDWDAIFPPGETVCNEAFTGFSVPMWSQ
jgi:hypothetical protein